MFRSTGTFDKLLDKATSHLLMEPDWKSTLQICDLIRQNDVQPKYALNALKKKLMSQNPHAAMYALMVLESMVKNCGAVIHEELTTKPFCEFLHELAKTTAHENVKNKLLELIQAWTFAFRKNPKHGALKDIVNAMKVEGFKFPTLRESDAMFSADTAPEWADGDVCHRCRVQFTLVVRKHHCRACGQVFCGQCTSRNITLPKFGIEKEVRVCDSCYDAATKPSSAPKTPKTETELPAEYLKSSLAQKSQEPPKKSEEELREEEELMLAIALSKSEAEAKEKEKKYPGAISNFKAVEQPVRAPTPEEHTNPELQKYLNRSYWESIQNDKNDQNTPASPSAPASAPIQMQTEKLKPKENGNTDNDLEEFIKTLKGQVEIFVNRMKSNSSRGRSIANDTSVQTLFMSITAMHSKLLHYIQEHDDKRINLERLQDKLTQVKDARAALDALREEHREKLRLKAEEAERQRQMQMAHKLEIMRKKKQEYLQYQRQLALQRIQEQEREMHMRQEQQKQQYMLPQYGYMGPAMHPGQQFSPNTGPAPGTYNTYSYPQHLMSPSQGQGTNAPQVGLPQGPLQHPSMSQTNTLPPSGFPQPTHPTATPNFPPGMPQQPRGMPPQPMLPPGMMGMRPGMPQGPPPQHQGMPQNQGGQMVSQQQVPPHFMQQNPGAPPPQPQPNQQPKEETQTAELISFD